MKFTQRSLLATTAGVVLVMLAGCSGQSTTDPDSITITVGDRPSADQVEAVKALDAQIEAFEKANPGVVIDSVETKWDPLTFQAMVAGGTMPTVLGVAFTEPQGLIANGQIADITKALDATGLGAQLNPSVVGVAQADGKTYGVPTDVYSVGLAFNRDLFVQAGLDPDAPPSTWDEVRESAKTISSATGATGYATYAAEHYGGWMTTAAIYSFGGQLENAEGTEATVDTDPVEGYLSLVHDMRWEDNSMGSNFLYSAQPALQDFAAGKIGMILGLPQDYPGLVTNLAMSPESYGFTALPQAGGENTTLSGGVVQVFKPTATEAEIEAGLKWIEFSRFGMYFDEKLAVDNAKAASADGSVVGLPALSPLNQSAYDQYREWIADYINVPLANFAGYTAVAEDQNVLPEPRTDAQGVYEQLDSVIQAVLTTEDLDLQALLKDTQTNVQAKLDRG